MTEHGSLPSTWPLHWTCSGPPCARERTCFREASGGLDSAVLAQGANAEAEGEARGDPEVTAPVRETGQEDPGALATPPPPGWLHGNLIPLNLLGTALAFPFT